VLAPPRGLMHHPSAGVVHPDRHLLMRRPTTLRTLGTPGTLGTASVTIGFEAGLPRSVNGVAMELPELIESLSLIARQCHVDDENLAPALLLLQSAYRESAGVGSVTLKLQTGSILVGSGFSRTKTEVHA